MSQGGFPAAAGPDLRIPAHLPFPFGDHLPSAAMRRDPSTTLRMTAGQHFVRTAEQRAKLSRSGGEFAQLYAPWALMIAQRGTSNVFLQTAHMRCLRVAR